MLCFAIARVKEKRTQFSGIIFCEYCFCCFHYTCTECFLGDSGHSYVSFQAKEDENISHPFNTQHFASSALFSFFGCPAQVEGIKLNGNINFSSHTFSNYTVARYVSLEHYK